MVRRYLGTIRGKLVLWYLSVLAILLIILGIFQAVTLTQYLQSSTATSLRQAAYSELRILGPCFLLSSADLEQKAQTLSQLLGSHETAVKIVTGSGVTLADHGLGAPGASRPLRLSAATIRRLIASARPGKQPASPPPSCQNPPPRPAHLHREHDLGSGAIGQGGLVLVAIPLGQFGHPVGYAILGRSFGTAASTIRRAELVFGIGAIVALLLAAVIALPLINRALRPLRRVAATAGSIAAGHLEQRANLTQSPDEIGRLGKSFDTMVDRLQAAMVAASESEERMRRFLADASHELRTPITVLRGMSEVLLRQAPGQQPEYVEALQDMHEEAVRLSTLVDDLLTLTRLDAGQGPNAEPLQVSSFLEQFRERYAPAWPSRTINLDVEHLDGAQAYVDPEALRRIITNLIDNAARYSAAGRPITVSARTERERVAVSVSDEGPGMTPVEVEHMFERFYRGSKSRTRQGAGSGLGLAIVNALVNQSHGSVQVSSAPDRGTTVTISLPLASAADSTS